jgi:hypothetical protein
MIDGYTRELGSELRRLGVPAARRRRLLTETEDHLRSDPGALSRFGSAGEIARQCADELGSSGARRVSITAFAVLAFAGMLFGALMLAVFAALPRHTILCCNNASAVQTLTFAVLVIAPQVAFVTGVLAVVRALRLRRTAALPRTEVGVLRRRSAVALLSGAATMAALVALVVQLAPVLPGWCCSPWPRYRWSSPRACRCRQPARRVTSSATSVRWCRLRCAVIHGRSPPSARSPSR